MIHRNSTMIRRATAWFILLLAIALFVAQVVFLRLTSPAVWSRRPFFWPIDPVNLSILAYSVVGALIALRRAHNVIGWLLCAMGLTWQLYACARAYASYLFLTQPSYLHNDDVVLILLLNLWVVAFGMIPFLLFLFPDGRLVQRGWRPVLWLLGGLIAIQFVGIETGFRAGSTALYFKSPLEALGIGRVMPAGEVVGNVGALVETAIFVLSGVALVLRLRRARGDERQQLKWFVYAGLVMSLVMLFTVVFFDWLRTLDPAALYQVDLFYGVPFAVPLAAIPLAIGVAIFKYHLYDIDLIIRKTLVYSILTALLALIYFGGVVLVQQLTRSISETSDLAIVVSTLAIAALFFPLRRRVQNVIDRRFYRRKYDAAKTLAAFGATVRDEVELEKLTAELLNVVNETMQPASVSLWLKAPDSATAGRRQSL